jgi:hypothetical protein
MVKSLIVRNPGFPARNRHGQNFGQRRGVGLVGVKTPSSYLTLATERAERGREGEISLTAYREPLAQIQNQGKHGFRYRRETKAYLDQ